MYYITVKQPPIYHQMTLEEFLFGTNVDSALTNPNLTNTKTYEFPYISDRFLSTVKVDKLIERLHKFNEQTAELHEKDRHSLYRTFHIPKKSGGLRTINAPEPELMTALRNLKSIFENDFGALYHTSAFAYVKHRSILDCLKRHQANESKWYAKFDLSNFFGSTTPEYVAKMFGMVFPFSEVLKDERGKAEFMKAIELCFLDGGLPQGTPISPTITNIMMIPVDFKLNKIFREFTVDKYETRIEEEFVKLDVNRNRNSEGYSDPTAHICTKKVKHYVKVGEAKQRFIYTRYADDFQVSSRYSFMFKAVEQAIIDTLREFDAPFQLNVKKTRYGSSAGSNWNLGLMTNKDNQITVGYKKKKQFQAMLFSYIMDKKNGVEWDKSDIMTLEGYRNYYHMVEGETIDRIIAHINQKHGVDVVKMIKEDLRG